MSVHSNDIRAMYKHTNRSLIYPTIIANLSDHHLEVNGREKRTGCFTLFVRLVSCDCYHFEALPHSDHTCFLDFWSPFGKGLISSLSCVLCFLLFFHFPLQFPGSGVVLDCMIT